MDGHPLLNDEQMNNCFWRLSTSQILVNLFACLVILQDATVYQVYQVTVDI